MNSGISSSIANDHYDDDIHSDIKDNTNMVAITSSEILCIALRYHCQNSPFF